MTPTIKDMDHPRFWEFNRIARQKVGETLTHSFLGAMNDREAKAVDDAVGALTKVLLIQEARFADTKQKAVSA